MKYRMLFKINDGEPTEFAQVEDKFSIEINPSERPMEYNPDEKKYEEVDVERWCHIMFLDGKGGSFKIISEKIKEEEK